MGQYPPLEPLMPVLWPYFNVRRQARLPTRPRKPRTSPVRGPSPQASSRRCRRATPPRCAFRRSSFEPPGLLAKLQCNRGAAARFLRARSVFLAGSCGVAYLNRDLLAKRCEGRLYLVESRIASQVEQPLYLLLRLSHAASQFGFRHVRGPKLPVQLHLGCGQRWNRHRPHVLAADFAGRWNVLLADDQIRQHGHHQVLSHRVGVRLIIAMCHVSKVRKLNEDSPLRIGFEKCRIDHHFPFLRRSASVVPSSLAISLARLPRSLVAWRGMKLVLPASRIFVCPPASSNLAPALLSKRFSSPAFMILQYTNMLTKVNTKVY